MKRYDWDEDEQGEWVKWDEAHAALATATNAAAGLGVELAAANARVAELERYIEAQKTVVLESRRDRTAANARADAAERLRREANAIAVECEDKLERAESEAAALRAENAKLISEHDALHETCCDLRAERDAANALLRWCRPWVPASRRLDAYLSSQESK